jgi:uncharacterized damage-inducible protein DinB
MTERKFRKGAVGALMDEYERAVFEYRRLIEEITLADFVRVADTETADEECRSIQTVTTHVVMAGYSYANYIREQFSLDFEPVSRETVTHADAGGALAKMLAYTEQSLDGRWEMTDEEISEIVIHSRWGVVYDLEQLLEHAVVHVLRHRRQIEKFLQKFKMAASAN